MSDTSTKTKLTTDQLLLLGDFERNHRQVWYLAECYNIPRRSMAGRISRLYKRGFLKRYRPMVGNGYNYFMSVKGAIAAARARS